MTWLVDAVYLVGAVLTAPFWLVRLIRTGKIHTDWAARLGRTERLPRTDRRRVLIHAVSLGEVNATRELVNRLEAAPDAPEIVIAVTTDTGLDRAQALYADRHPVVRMPFDFGPSISRFLRAVHPDVLVLIELEVWPNTTKRCAALGIPVVVVNGRLSARSFRRYRLIGPLVRPMFRRLSRVAAQNEDYAARFRALGTAPDRVQVTDNMKWDSARISDTVDGADTLAEELGIDRSRRLVVGGSTAPEEHTLLHDAVPDGVQLLCAPRRPEWFDGAARDLPGCARRSRGEQGSSTDRFLLDTTGELRRAYAFADVIVMGRSFGTLHGSDMTEPIALGKATVVGPAVDDFRAAVDALLAGDGLIQTDRDGLRDVLHRLCDDAKARRALGERGRDVIRAHQGASTRNAELILSMLPASRGAT